MSYFMLLLEGLLFAVFAVWILYFLLFSIFYRIPKSVYYPVVEPVHRYLVVFPAYKEDGVILQSILKFLEQDYPAAGYEVVVISDSMQEATNGLLTNAGATVLIPDFAKRSKAAALGLAMEYSVDMPFDAVVILDADNWVESDFLTQVNRAFSSGLKAIQVHRIAKNENTDLAYLDGISEEINNSIFRQGHVNFGLPAALTGSGMVFDIHWFRHVMPKVSSVGEDKELEFYLLEDRVYTGYLDHVYVLDEKVQNKRDFSNQRQRWLAAQLERFVFTVKRIVPILRSRNWPLFDKLVQWSIPPRIILLGVIPVWIFVLWFFSSALVYKWIILYLLYLLALLLAIPDRFYNKRTLSAFLKLPMVFVAMLQSFRKIKSARTTFIHTPHGEREENNSN